MHAIEAISGYVHAVGLRPSYSPPVRRAFLVTAASVGGALSGLAASDRDRVAHKGRRLSTPAHLLSLPNFDLDHHS
jgi:hypothetical protein